MYSLLVLASLLPLASQVACAPQAERGDDLLTGSPAPLQNSSNEAWLRENLTFGAAQYAHLASALAHETRFPRSFDGTQWTLRPASDWTSGFFPGSLWFAYDFTRDPTLRAPAERWTERMEQEQTNTRTHDLGFMMLSSFGQGLRLTHEPRYRSILLTTANTLASRFDGNVGCIRSWDWGPWRFPVIIDNMMNLELLFWAAREGGDGRLRDMAVSHADRTLANHYRPDGSSFHVVDYDPTTGAVLSRGTHQGLSDSSAWARGQAWGLYGFTMTYRETREERFLRHAEKVADFLLGHPRLPADGVPPWDFDDVDAGAPRDTSAAAIMASALLELSGFSTANGPRYAAAAEHILRSLSSPAYRAVNVGENGGFILAHSVGNRPEGSEIDVPLIYADYYFLEANLRALAGVAPLAGGDVTPSSER